MNITLQQSVLSLVWGSSSMSTHEHLSHLKNQTTLITYNFGENDIIHD